MNFILKLFSFKHSVTAYFFPEKRKTFLKHYSSLPMPERVPNQSFRIWYRLLNRGVLSIQTNIDIKKEAQLILETKNTLPLVSCLLVTKNRFQLAKKSVGCFLQQSYPNRELIIINDDSNLDFKEWVKKLNNPNIKFYHLPDESKKLGVLRNLSREKARGEYIAQWDDDDLSSPDRLLFQMTLALKFNLDGCSLQREQLWFPSKNRFGFSSHRLWEGSMVARSDKLISYHEVCRGEETDAVNNLALEGKIGLLDFPELYTYCFHGENTWDEQHFEHLWNNATKVFKKKDILKNITESIFH